MREKNKKVHTNTAHYVMRTYLNIWRNAQIVNFQLMKKHKKPIYIEDKLGYEEMRRFADQLGISINTAFPGYIRQPIKIERNIAENYIIRGTCALNLDECNRMVSRNSEYNCSMCLIYKRYFDEQKT